MKKLTPTSFREEYVTINETNPINQYLLHYEAEGANVMLFIHGGPGMSQSCFGYYLKGLFQDNFSLVFYDQRGAGRTYLKNPKLKPTLELQLEDLHSTVIYLKRKYHTEKIIIIGHSWGNVLGYIYALQHPENLTHFISIGQVCDMTESEAIAFKKLTQVVKESSHKKDKKQIMTIGEYPPGAWNGNTMKLYAKVDKLKSKYKLIFSTDIPLSKIARNAPTKFKIRDIVAMFKAGKVNSEMFIKQMNEFSPQKYGTSFEVPLLFIMGENDYVTPLEVFMPLYHEIISQKKELAVLKNTGHMIPFERPTEFADIVMSFIK